MFTDVVSSYNNDKFATKAVAQLSVDAAAIPHFTLNNGLLRFKNRIWVGNDVELHHRLITTFHSAPLGGHYGFPMTSTRLKKYFAWKQMKQDVHNFVTSCQICQQAKPDRSRYPGLLQPLPIPDGAWQIISLDYILWRAYPLQKG